MNELKTILKTHIANLLEEAQKSAMNPDNFESLMPHPDYPHCETYVVELVDSIKASFEEVHLNVSKSDLVNIFYRYNGNVNANEARLEDIMKLA
tara:strand:- start:3345 stop:3626 length:282 start_codon:yes stop_codon:yes gene_type:complete